MITKTEDNEPILDIEEQKKQREAVKGVLYYLDSLIESHSISSHKLQKTLTQRVNYLKI